MRNPQVYIEGDKTIWVLVALLCLFSFIPVYSTSSYFAHMYDMSPAWIILKHLIHILTGIFIIFLVHKRDFTKIRRFSPLFLVGVIVLLAFTLLQGNTIQGANASRWIRVPLVGSFQPSALGAIVLIIYLSQMMGKVGSNKIKLHYKHPDFLKIMGAIVGICGLIFPANLSTAAMIALMSAFILLIGNFPWRMMLSMALVGLILASSFIGLAIAKPDLFPSRVNTWANRIESFSDSKENYQSLRAKNAIVNGGLFGKGPGKSMYKNVLPQSSSDFIFAILVEEFGLVFSLFVIAIYTVLFLRGIALYSRAEHPAEKLTIIGLVLWMTTQAYVNMSVAEGLMPVTGQTLPLISTGGSSIWMTSVAIGLILSISKKEKKK